MHAVPLEYLNRQQSLVQFPSFHVPEYFETIYEPDAGFISPEKAISLYKEEAEKNGAAIHTNEAVLEWKKENNGMKVVTNKSTYYSKKLIIAPGAWAGKILPQLGTELNVTRQAIAWIEPRNPGSFLLGHFPCWLLEDEQRGVYYGFPILPSGKFNGPAALKIARHYPGQITDPDSVNRQINPEDEEDIRLLIT